MAAREGRRTTLSNARRNLADRDQRKDGPPSRSRRSLQSEGASHWAAALERLQAVGSQNLAIREAPKGTAGSSAAAWVMVEGKAVIRLDANSSLGQAYQTLWTEASPQKIQPTLNGLDGPGAPVEVRRVSWRNVRDAELPIRHGQVLILADKTFLVWLTDDQLYLLQASPTAESRG